MPIYKRYSFLWVTLVLFLGSLIGHWTFAWYAYKSDQEAHQRPVVISEYVTETVRDTFENWQSEFLQLIWQVAGLAFLLHIGSPQSKEGDERKEEKIDAILRTITKDGDKIISDLNRRFPKS